jgi:hypothetical protein
MLTRLPRRPGQVKLMAFFILPLLSARDLDIGPEGRYQSRADDKGNMKKAMY